MNTIKVIILVLISVISLQLSAKKPQKETFKVWGNCEMCQTKIEKAAKSVIGVRSARWNVNTKQLTVKFNPEKTSVDTIQKAIAAIGYDTEKYKANDTVYENLHHCCQYDRK